MKDDTDAIRVLMPEMPTLEEPVRTRPGKADRPRAIASGDSLAPKIIDADNRRQDLSIELLTSGELTITVEEVAKVLQISRTSAYESVRRADLESLGARLYEHLSGVPSRTLDGFVHLLWELSTFSEDGALLEEGFRYPMESFGGDR